MFLGGLSTTTERKARKEGGSSGQKGKGSSSSRAPDVGASVSEGSLRRLPKGARPIIYGASNPDIPREVMLRYFRDMCRMIFDEANMLEMIEERSRGSRGLEQIASEFQRDVLEYNFQIERNFGCRHMSSIPVTSKGDTELLEAGLEFVRTCQRGYLDMLRLRASRNGNPRRTSGPMTRTEMTEFFEGCNAMMGLSETKQELKTIFETTGGPPNARIVELQRSVLELIGLDPDFGVSCLNRMGTDYPQDEDLHMKMNQFALCASLAGREAMMSPEEKEQFYADIPLFLHPFPHVFVFHQQMQQMKAQRENGPMQQMKSLMANEETRAKIIDLSGRMENSQVRVQNEVVEWSTTRKKEFVISFSSNSILNEMNGITDPVARLQRFITMSDAELDGFMTIQAILSADIKSNGSMLRELLHEGGANARGLMGSLQQLQGIIGAGMQAGGGHVHGPDCNHGACEVRAPDVTTGVSAKMDR